MSAFGIEVKRLRGVAGLTQKQLSEAAGVSQPTIAQLESGRIPGVSNATLYALSDALGVGCEHWRKFLADEPAEEKPAAKPKGGKKK